MRSYEDITASFRYAHPDAEFILHQTVEEILNSGGNDKEKLYKIRRSYASAKAGKAARDTEFHENMEVSRDENV